MTDVALRALVLVCSLKPTPAESSSQLLGQQVLDELKPHGVTGEVVRVVDHDVRFGVSTDEGGGDQWPDLREKMLGADILVIATPIWMGQPASVCKLVLERLDAEISERDDEGRMLTEGKVAIVAVVGNEDGAHHVVAEVLQALNDTGFSIPANAGTYWVGEAMGSTDYLDLDETPEKTASTTATTAAHAVHLARLLKDAPYPPA
jgi:multimeric flavodoxin WrbA